MPLAGYILAPGAGPIPRDSFRNTLPIRLQPPHATAVMRYRAWQAPGLSGALRGAGTRQGADLPRAIRPSSLSRNGPSETPAASAPCGPFRGVHNPCQQSRSHNCGRR